MRVLFLTQIIPYPPDAGPKVKTWHVLRFLAESGHRITLVSFVRPEERPFVDRMREVCEQVHTIPIRRSRLSDLRYWLRSHLTGRPFLIERDDLRAMRATVTGLLEKEQFDLVHADQLTMTQFAPLGRNTTGSLHGTDGESSPARVFDAHNAVWTIVERMRENAPLPLQPVLGLEARRIKAYEGRIVRTFEHTLAVTEPDRRLLAEAAAFAHAGEAGGADTIRVIPIAVDTRQLPPARRRPGSTNILTLGTLHYPPNADGILWFGTEVFPRILTQMPDVTLTIVGKNPPPSLRALATQHPDSVEVTGYVPDLDPYMDAAALMVVPVRAGGGMRVRILEAFARAMPVVTTRVGLEGIEARDGEDVLVEDDPAEFAKAVLRVLQDDSLQARLAHNGRRLAESKYDWQVVLEDLHDLYPPMPSPAAAEVSLA